MTLNNVVNFNKWCRFIFKSNPLQYFYTDISMYSQGQVIINTKRGEGVIYVKLNSVLQVMLNAKKKKESDSEEDSTKEIKQKNQEKKSEKNPTKDSDDEYCTFYNISI